MTALPVTEHAALEIDGAPFEVIVLRGEEALSTLFRFEITCAGAPDPASLLGSGAAIALTAGAGAGRRIHGIVAEASTSASEAGASITAVIRPAIFPLTLGRDSRVFHDMSAVEIAQQVLAASPAPVRWQLTRAYPKRAACAQRGEDDFSFVSRLMAEEGIFFWFDHEGGPSALVFADDSTSAPDLEGGGFLAFAPDAGMRGEGERIVELGSTLRASASKITVGSFDPDHPRTRIRESAGGGSIEVYDAPGGGPTRPAIAAARARTRLEAAAAGRSGVSGAAASARVYPGRALEMGGHPAARLDGRYLVTRAIVEIDQRRRGGAAPVERAFTCRFEAMAHAVPFRAPAPAPRVEQPGLQTGQVMGSREAHHDPAGRVRVKLHFERDAAGAPGRWMRVAQRGTADSQLLPRAGWSVVALHEEGSADAPSVLSRIHDAEHPPPYALPAHKTRTVFRTAETPGSGSYNEIRLEDRQGAEELLMEASKDMGVRVQAARADAIGRDAGHDVGGDHALAVGGDHAEIVEGDQRVTIGGREARSASGAVEKSVGGAEIERIAGERSLHAGAMHTTTVAGERSLSVGTVLLDASLGTISATSGRTATIRAGGARVAVSAGQIAEQVQALSAQTIGGAKVEISKAGRSLEVKGDAVETVGGVLIEKTLGAFSETAATELRYGVGGLFSAGAPEIVIEADDRIEIKCGASSIAVLPDRIEIKASTLKIADSSELVAVSDRIDYN
jgi:type VI secretion system secreted protein VgrG